MAEELDERGVVADDEREREAELGRERGVWRGVFKGASDTAAAGVESEEVELDAKSGSESDEVDADVPFAFAALALVLVLALVLLLPLKLLPLPRLPPEAERGLSDVVLEAAAALLSPASPLGVFPRGAHIKSSSSSESEGSFGF